MSTTEKNRDLTMQVVGFLEKAGIDVSFKRFTTDNVQIKCPFAAVSGHRDGVDSNPSLGLRITLDAGFMWHCFTCGRKGRSLIGFIKELQKAHLLTDATEAYRLQNSIRVAFPGFYEELIVDAKELVYTLDKFIVAWLSKAATEYHTAKRHITPAVVQECRLHFDREHQQVIFPCYAYADPALHGWVAHYINGRKPKYSNNFYTGDYLYLEWLAKGASLIVVEGMYDAIKIYSHLRTLDLLGSYSVVGTYGSEVSPRQMHKIVRFADTVLLMGDNDDAGIKMENRIFYGVRRKNPRIYKLPYIGKDPGEVSLSRFQVALASRLPFKAVGSLHEFA